LRALTGAKVAPPSPININWRWVGSPSDRLFELLITLRHPHLPEILSLERGDITRGQTCERPN